MPETQAAAAPTATASYKRDPPTFTKDMTFDDYKKDVEIWKACTDLAVDKQGPILYLSLQGTARDIVRANVPLAEMSKNEGIQTILTSLKSAYSKSKADDAFDAFDEFSNFRRPSNMNIDEFLLKFNLKLKLAEEHNMKLESKVYWDIFCLSVQTFLLSTVRFVVPLALSSPLMP